MTPKLRLLLAQINPTVAAISSNAALIKDIIQTEQENHDLIVFPELALTGYPPEDLLLRESFYKACDEALKEIAKEVGHCYVIIGHPSAEQGKHFNSASVYYQGQRLCLYHKQILPSYGVFDERRYFSSGEAKPCVFNVKGLRLGLCICEDIWGKAPMEQMIAAQADALVCINASPFDKGKYQLREDLLRKHVSRAGLAIFYVNQVGGQDELLFDGQSFAVDAAGQVKARAKAFVPELLSMDFENKEIKGSIEKLKGKEELLYDALVLATRDYVEKNHFPSVILGLSGGIDSALVLAIAVDALGPSRVKALMLPSRHTAEISISDAQEELDSLGVQGHFISIEPAYKSFLESIDPYFKDRPKDTTEENIQARIRGTLLMAFSNKEGHLLLTTSNKSESAVGYATLYGDMAGGFAVLKDVLKTEVYALARYRNSISPVIPERAIQRAPSAELADNQRDQDSLPDYPTLDAIIQKHMEENLDVEAIVTEGFDRDVVCKVLRLIKNAEHKRRQTAPGPKISVRAFGKDWRFPITNGA